MEKKDYQYVKEKTYQFELLSIKKIWIVLLLLYAVICCHIYSEKICESFIDKSLIINSHILAGDNKTYISTSAISTLIS